MSDTQLSQTLIPNYILRPRFHPFNYVYWRCQAMLCSYVNIDSWTLHLTVSHCTSDRIQAPFGGMIIKWFPCLRSIKTQCGVEFLNSTPVLFIPLYAEQNVRKPKTNLKQLASKMFYPICILYTFKHYFLIIFYQVDP